MRLFNREGGNTKAAEKETKRRALPALLLCQGPPYGLFKATGSTVFPFLCCSSAPLFPHLSVPLCSVCRKGKGGTTLGVKRRKRKDKKGGFQYIWTVLFPSTEVLLLRLSKGGVAFLRVVVCGWLFCFALWPTSMYIELAREVSPFKRKGEKKREESEGEKSQREQTVKLLRTATPPS